VQLSRILLVQATPGGLACEELSVKKSLHAKLYLLCQKHVNSIRRQGKSKAAIDDYFRDACWITADFVRWQNSISGKVFKGIV
jgi:hypothetical protein